jgi:hypothetical protein
LMFCPFDATIYLPVPRKVLMPTSAPEMIVPTDSVPAAAAPAAAPAVPPGDGEWGRR